MRGIEIHIPAYPKRLLHPADVVTWEAQYADGRTVREREGAQYAGIDRSQLAAFSIVQSGEILFTIWPPDGATGWNLCYRRVSDVGVVGRSVKFVMGWAPMGPVHAIDVERMAYRTAPRFDVSDGDFFPPVPHPHEGEHWTLDDFRITV